MRLRKIAGLSAAAILLLGNTAYAQESLTETQAVESGMTETQVDDNRETEAFGETAAGVEQTAGELSDQWSDFQVQIDGTVYSFPMAYEDWLALGWEAEDATEEELEPYQYGMLYYRQGNRKCMAYVLNLGINNEPVENCIVAGMNVDPFYWESGDGEVVLPSGIVRGETTGKEITAAYGTPSDSYEGELYTSYTYELDYNCSLELTVDRESGVLSEIDIRNFVEPEGFEAGEVSEEVPAAVTAYAKPEMLSDDLTAYEIQLDGAVYSLPVPVSVLLADGWEINPSETDESVMANSSGWVGLIKGGQSFHTMARNGEAYATVPENCWLESIEVGGFDLKMDGALPGGVEIGMTEEAFLALLEANGMEYELSESGDFKYYTYNSSGYGHDCETLVYTADDGTFEKDTVIRVSCSNSVE